MAKAVSASQNGLTRIYRNDDGSVTVLRGGGRNWRNNNPGNIKYGGNGKAAGAIGRCPSRVDTTRRRLRSRARRLRMHPRRPSSMRPPSVAATSAG